MNVSYVKPDYKAVAPSNPYSLDLMGRMLMDKAQRYETNYAQLSQEAAINEATGANIMNIASREYANQKLNGLMDSVNGDLGNADLSKMQERQAFSSKMQEFSRDPRLIQAVGDSRKISAIGAQYQKDLEKNPNNIVNYSLFQQDVQQYVNDPEGAPYRGMNFMGYVDVDKSFGDMFEQLKADGVLKQSGTPGEYIYTVTNENVDGSRIEQIVYNHLQSNPSIMGQVRNNARYYMQNMSDSDLGESYANYAQQRVVENSGAATRIKGNLARLNATDKLVEPDKDAKVAALEEQLKFVEGDIERYRGIASDPKKAFEMAAVNRQGVWQELHTNSLVNKFKSIYAYSNDKGFKVDDVSDPYAKASSSSSAGARAQTENGQFQVSDNAIVFDPQDGKTGVVELTSSSLGADVQDAMTVKSKLESDFAYDLKLRYGGIPGNDLGTYIQEQEALILKNEKVDPEYLDFRNKYVANNHRLENAAYRMNKFQKEAQQLYQSGVANQLPERFKIFGGDFSRQEMSEFMSVYGSEFKDLGMFPGEDKIQTLTKKIIERGQGPVADALKKGQLSIDTLYDTYRMHSNTFGFVNDYVSKNMTNAVLTRIPKVVLNEKQKNDEVAMGQMSGLVSHDRQMQGLPSVKNIKPIKYGYDHGNLYVTYEYEDGDKQIQTETTAMLKADQTPNAFGGLLQQDPYEDLRNTIMQRGSTSPDAQNYKSMSPVVQVPYTVKKPDGTVEKKFKPYYVRFSDKARHRMNEQGSDPLKMMPDQGINLDMFQFVDPEDPKGWLNMVDSEGRMLPPVRTVEEAMRLATTYLQSRTQLTKAK